MNVFPVQTKLVGEDSFFYSEKANFIEVKKGYLFEVENDGLDTVLDFLVPGNIAVVTKERSLFSLYSSEIAIVFPNSSEQLLLYEQRKARSDKLLALNDSRSSSLARVAGTIYWTKQSNLDNISQNAIAMICNLNRETVSRKIAYLKKKGIVNTSARSGNKTGCILVIDEKKIKAIAQINRFD